MKYVNGLYASLVLIMLVHLIDSTIFDNKYSGIAIFISLFIFLAGTMFFINAKKIIINT